jgi:hypothetical protein
MSTNTLTYSHSEAATAQADTPARKSIWRRLFDAMIASQQRRAEREIAHYLASRGGILNDETEREIMQRLSGGRPRSV